MRLLLVLQAVAQLTTAQPSERLVSINAERRSVESVVRELSAQAGVPIAYGDAVIRSQAVVTAKLNGVTLRTALAQVLSGTRLVARISADDKGYVIEQIASAKAKRHGIITGKVIDSKTGRGVAGVSVSLDADTRGVNTDEAGVYLLSGVSTGTHMVTVRLVGYTKQTRSVIVGEGGTTSADFKLDPSASVLDQVVVTGTVVQSELRSVPNAITVITAKQIEDRGITRIDRLFRGDVPGLFSLNLGSGALLDEVTVFSRGATSLINAVDGGSAGTSRNTNPVKTYLDGVELADPQYLSQIDPSSIERIEILTGPQASTVYGSNAINGVIQIFTKRGNFNKAKTVFDASSGIAQNNFNSHLAPSHLFGGSISGTEGRLSYNAGGSWDYSGSWSRAKQTQRLSTNGAARMDFGKLQADISARRGLTRNRQKGDGQETSTQLSASGLWEFNSVTRLPLLQVQDLDGITLGASATYRPLSWWSHEIGGGRDMSSTDFVSPLPRYLGISATTDTTLSVSYSTLSRVSYRYNSTAQLSLNSFSQLTLVLGADNWHTRGSSWSAFPVTLSGKLASPSATLNKSDKNSGAFVQGQLGLKDALFFTYGVRADWNPTFGDKARVLPGRYGLAYSKDFDTPLGSISTKLRGSYGRAIRPPQNGFKQAVPQTIQTRITLFGPHDTRLANPDLTPEHQQGGEGGIELYFNSRASLSITRYNQTVDNLISLVGSLGAEDGPGLDSVRSIIVPTTAGQIASCSSTFRDENNLCYIYQQQYLNVGSIRNQGWETQGSLSLGPISARGSYSWTKSRVIGVTPKYKDFLVTSAFQSGRPFTFLPEHTWALTLAYSHTKSSVALSLNGIGMRYVQTNSVLYGLNYRLPTTRSRAVLNSTMYRPLEEGYAIADLNAAHRFSALIDATLQINNLTDYYVNDLTATNTAIGRQSRLGLRVRY